MIRFCLWVVLLCCCSSLSAQTHSFTGNVADSTAQPIEGVTCVLRMPADSAFSRSVLSDAAGVFRFAELPAGVYTLFLTHLSYQYREIAVTIERDLTETQPYVIQNQFNSVDEVVVNAERPQVRIADGKLIYSGPVLLENKIASTAFDLLSHVPNMTGTGDNLSLVGASGYSILIDGKPTTLSKSQMIERLKAIPASRVADIEIMYSAPPQYNVRGALVNIVLKGFDASQGGAPLQGEVAAEYDQGRRPGGGIRANLLYERAGTAVDLTVGAKTIGMWTQDDMWAEQRFDGSTYHISEIDRSTPDASNLDLRLGVTRTFKHKNALSFTYTGNLTRGVGSTNSQAVFLRDGELYREADSRNFKHENAYLHNLQLNYTTPSHLAVGVDYTLYRNPGYGVYREFAPGGDVLTQYKTKTVQNIHKVLFYANRSSSLGRDWRLDYGLKFSFSGNHNDYNHFKQVEALQPDSINRVVQQEFAGSAYVGFSKTIGEKFSAQASFSGGFYHADIEAAGTKRTLWSQFEPFVNANLSYSPSQHHVLMLSFSSNAQYPPYWAMSNEVFRLNPYTILKGNPELKYSRQYETNLIYTLHKKYTFIGSYTYMPDYFGQMPFQSGERLENVYEMVNLDYQQQYGLTAIVPFRVGKLLDSKVTANVSRTSERCDDFNGLAFRFAKTAFMFQMDNTFTISSKPNLKAELSGFYLSGALQGVMDIRHLWSVDAGLKWQSVSRKFEVAAKVQDIFRSGTVNLVTDYQTQHSTLKSWPNTPFLKLTFNYRFGNYTKKETPGVDMSRFKQ